MIETDGPQLPYEVAQRAFIAECQKAIWQGVGLVLLGIIILICTTVWMAQIVPLIPPSFSVWGILGLYGIGAGLFGTGMGFIASGRSNLKQTLSETPQQTFSTAR